ncbi:hypothetical protein, partial [Gracilibacillus sp. JCM 18860]|uniref:hypothetical protein n=1 Tax=Gracilibacillus sp. JCM 18860 TaxID=1306159 RepID=UPI000A90D818
MNILPKAAYDVEVSSFLYNFKFNVDMDFEPCYIYICRLNGVTILLGNHMKKHSENVLTILCDDDIM